MMGKGSRLAAGCIGAALTGCVLLVGPGAAVASDDGGIAAFFSNQFGIGRPQPAYAPPIWADPDSDDRPLIVRPRKRSAPRVARVVVGPTPKISIFEDKTLRRGDAVMTAEGIRIFRGSATPPYRNEDFMAVSDAGGLSKDVTKALTAIDRAPRS